MEKTQRPLGRPRKEHGDIPTKDMILHTATALFLEKGFPLVSMDDVAEKCNVTKATVYYYYKTKAELFTDAMIQLMNRIKQKSAAILATEEPLNVQLLNIAKAHLEATVNVDINAFMKEAKISLSAEQVGEMAKAEEALYNELENTLAEAMDKGKIPDNNPRLAAFIFINLLTVRNVMDEKFKKSFTTTEELAKQIIDFYWNGLAGGR